MLVLVCCFFVIFTGPLFRQLFRWLMTSHLINDFAKRTEEETGLFNPGNQDNSSGQASSRRVPASGSHIPKDTLPDCTFCRIISGEEHAHKIYEDEHVIAILGKPDSCMSSNMSFSSVIRYSSNTFWPFTCDTKKTHTTYFRPTARAIWPHWPSGQQGRQSARRMSVEHLIFSKPEQVLSNISDRKRGS